MPIDASIPLQGKMPEFDVAKPLSASLNIGLHAQDFRKKEATYNALQEYGKALQSGDEGQIQSSIAKVGAVDPEQGKTLLGLRQGVRQAGAQDTFGKTGDPADVQHFPDVLKTVTEVKSIKDENVRKQTIHKYDVGGRHAEGYLKDPTPEAWESMLDSMVKSGAYSHSDVAPFRGKPNSIQAARMRAAGMSAREGMEVSGEAAGNRPMGTAPTETVVIPNQARPDSATIFGKTPISQTPPQSAPETRKGDPIYNEVPKIDLSGGKSGPGVIRQGQDPSVMKAKEMALVNYEKEIQPGANVASKTKGELSIINSQLDKEGALTTGITAGIRETAAAIVYEVTRSPELAQNMTGINPTSADIFNKSSTRLGFDMAREQGAREAVQVIQYAFRANPNLFMTKEGNKTVTGVLDAVADWKIDRAKYAGKFLEKNGHLVNFDNWWNDNKPVEQYISKVVPLQFPSNPAELKNGVYYEWNQQDGDKSVKLKGKWDAEQQGMVIQ